MNYYRLIYPVLLTAVGFALGGVPAAAQTELSDVVVEATHVPNMEPIGRNGQPVSVVSVSHRVKYDDLDLATNSGAMELEKRVKIAAKDACDQLVTLYPKSAEGSPPCVERATKAGLERAHKAIAAAEKAAKK